MVGPSVFAVGLVATGHSAQLEHIVVDYTVVAVPDYTAVVPPFAAEVQTAAVL